MRSRNGFVSRGRAGACAALALSAVFLGGCLGEPEIEDRWTRIDIESSSLVPYQTVPGGTTIPVTGRMHVTYRAILTGVAVAELRGSTSIGPTSVIVHPDADRPPMANDIDRILAQSVTLGRSTRAVTGWHHLIQPIDFSFDGVVPAGGDSLATGLFLLCYLGEGDEIELEDGSDSLIVTPFPSGQYQILPVGLELGVGGP